MNDDPPRSSGASREGTGARADSADQEATLPGPSIRALFSGERAFHHPHRAAGAGQRVLRDRRVRARPLAPRAARGARRRRRPRRPPGAAGRSTTSATTSRPARSGSRWPRSRSARSASPRSRTCSSTRFGGANGRRARGRDLGGDLLPADHERPEHRRRDRPEALHDPARGGVWRAAIAGPLRFFRVLFTRSSSCSNSASYSILRMLGTDPDAEPEGGTPEELKRLIA